MKPEEVKAGDSNCQHTYSRQNKATFSILTRVCTRCGQEDLVCDHPEIDGKIAKQLTGRQ